MRTIPGSLALAAFLVLPGASSLAQDASPWSMGHHSRVRLVSGGSGPAGAGERLAAVQVSLDEGYKTYWRHPGDSGLPPRFDWSRTKNVASVELGWPAPARFEDAAGVSYGWTNGVDFPLTVRAERPGEPVELALSLDFGVCKDICIPAQAELSLRLTDAAAHRPLVTAAMSRVPKPVPLNGPGPLAVLSVVPAEPGGLAVEVRATGPAQLFAEGPDGWFLDAPEPSGPGGGRIALRILERPKSASGPVALRLTLVAGQAAVETSVTLDAGAVSR